jgi:hypothetical protein
MLDGLGVTEGYCTLVVSKEHIQRLVIDPYLRIVIASANFTSILQ